MKFTRYSSILLALAVIVGAFGAHGIKPHISAEHFHSFETGVEYHFYHALGMLLISVLVSANVIIAKRASLIQWLLFFGILLFSGSLYFLSTREMTGWEPLSILGPVTPIGGLLFIAAWIITAFSIKTPGKS